RLVGQFLSRRELRDNTCRRLGCLNHRSTKGSRTKIVSSRSGLVESSATGAPISSSTRRIYLIAVAGNCAQERAPPVDCAHPSKVSDAGVSFACSLTSGGK